MPDHPLAAELQMQARRLISCSLVLHKKKYIDCFYQSDEAYLRHVHRWRLGRGGGWGSGELCFNLRCHLNKGCMEWGVD